MYMCTHIYVYVYLYLYICVYTCIRMCVYIYMYMYVYNAWICPVICFQIKATLLLVSGKKLPSYD